MFDLFLERREFFLKAAEGVFGEGHRNLGCCGDSDYLTPDKGLRPYFQITAPAPRRLKRQRHVKRPSVSTSKGKSVTRRRFGVCAFTF